jgi:S1-C subfamily serine protease
LEPPHRPFLFTQCGDRCATLHAAPGGAVESLAITADYARGSSGGPVFDDRGNVVGMVASTDSIYYDQENGQQKNLQMVFKNCVSARSILALIGPKASK